MPLLPPAFLPFWWKVDGDSITPIRRQGYALGFFFVLCALAAFYSSLYAPSVSGTWGWYPRLLKPSWLPSPAFTRAGSNVFFTVLAFAIWRIWRTGAFRTIPFTLIGFSCLLFLQAIWTTVFYGLQSPALGFADLSAVAVLAAVLWLTVRPLDALAGRLWLAYLCWTLLLLSANATIWWLNA